MQALSASPPQGPRGLEGSPDFGGHAHTGWGASSLFPVVPEGSRDPDPVWVPFSCKGDPGESSRAHRGTAQAPRLSVLAEVEKSSWGCLWGHEGGQVPGAAANTPPPHLCQNCTEDPPCVDYQEVTECLARRTWEQPPSLPWPSPGEAVGHRGRQFPERLSPEQRTKPWSLPAATCVRTQLLPTVACQEPMPREEQMLPQVP